MENAATVPVISIVIPLYNTEKYIGECLDSVLAQTFQNFEVIVVNDCSTDNSIEVVKGYAEKFNGRLKLYHMDNNTGSGALPRNKGLLLSRGEYIFFMDADDVLIKSALEKMHALAGEYDADVVYCEKYFISTGTGEEFLNNVRVCLDSGHVQTPPFVDKPTFESENMSERVDGILHHRVWVVPWNKFVRRNLMLENEIFFPHVKIAEDNIWTSGLFFFAKKFLRVPNIVYVRRKHEESMTGTKRTPQEQINFWINPVLLGLKFLDKMMSRIEFFQENPNQRYAVLEDFVQHHLKLGFRNAGQLLSYDVYSTIKDEFGDKLGEHDVLIPALCAALHSEKKSHSDDAEKLIEFKRKFTARIDVKLVPGDAGGDLQILSVSDDKAKISKPEWLNKDGIAYLIRSYSGKVKLVAKTEADGQLQLALRSLNVPNPADKNKSIRYWIYYKSLKINGKAVFNEITPARYGKAYMHDMDVKAGEEITIEIEWLS